MVHLISVIKNSTDRFNSLSKYSCLQVTRTFVKEKSLACIALHNATKHIKREYGCTVLNDFVWNAFFFQPRNNLTQEA